MAAGAAAGLFFPSLAHPAETAINLALGLLLYVTFLGVPFGRLRLAFRDWRFLATLLVVSFVLVPIVVFGLSRMIRCC